MAHQTQPLSIDEELKELEINLSRLRVEYEQFFRGSLKREPTTLRAKVQKIITHLVNEPPRSSQHKFRFNSLNARFQSYRALWGRTSREMESGTHRSQRFRDALHESERDEQMRMAAEAESSAERAAEARRGAVPGQTEGSVGPAASPLDRLCQALVTARKQTGESDLSRERIAELIRKQTEAIKARLGPDAKVKFRVVVEDNKAKLKASVV
jgi:chromosome segregation ATPase